jgi:hypothetical protein
MDELKTSLFEEFVNMFRTNKNLADKQVEQIYGKRNKVLDKAKSENRYLENLLDLYSRAYSTFLGYSRLYTWLQFDNYFSELNKPKPKPNVNLVQGGMFSELEYFDYLKSIIKDGFDPKNVYSATLTTKPLPMSSNLRNRYKTFTVNDTRLCTKELVVGGKTMIKTKAKAKAKTKAKANTKKHRKGNVSVVKDETWGNANDPS